MIDFVKSSVVNNLYIQRSTFVIVAFCVYFIIRHLLNKSIDLIFSGIKERIDHDHALAKSRTLRSLSKSIVNVVVFFLTILTILANWNINIGPILAGAGILGLGVSFGLQSLVKDIVSGFFIILEDQFNIEDSVQIGAYKGTVYKMTLRMIILKDNDQNLIYIPNSQINSVVRFHKK